MAIIGFVVLVLLGLWLLVVTGAWWFGNAMFGSGDWSFLIPGTVAAAVLWAAFHFAPFSVTFVGVHG